MLSKRARVLGDKSKPPSTLARLLCISPTSEISACMARRLTANCLANMRSVNTGVDCGLDWTKNEKI